MAFPSVSGPVYGPRGGAKVVARTKLDCILAVVTLLFAFGTANIARANEMSRASVVVSLRGPSPVKRALGRQVRRSLADTLGPLKSSRKWQRSLGELGLSGSAKNRAVNIARAARMMGTAHVLDLKMMRKGDRDGVKVRVIRAQDGRIMVRRRLALGTGSNAVPVLADRIVRLALLTLKPPVESSSAQADSKREPPGNESKATPPEAQMAHTAAQSLKTKRTSPATAKPAARPATAKPATRPVTAKPAASPATADQKVSPATSELPAAPEPPKDEDLATAPSEPTASVDDL
ncbi:MAG: hypothetical protein AAF449_01525 [Myxococcota bacterium]